MMEFEIKLNDLIFYAYHGVYNSERETGNEFTVSLSVFLDCTENISEDRLEDTVSYADLYEIVRKEMGKPRKLLETVAYSIANEIQKTFPRVKGGKVSINKRRPPIPGMLGSAGVILSW